MPKRERTALRTRSISASVSRADPGVCERPALRGVRSPTAGDAVAAEDEAAIDDAAGAADESAADDEAESVDP